MEPRRLALAFLRRRMPFIASIIAHTAQIAMTALIKRIYSDPPPMSYKRPLVQPRLAGRAGRHGGAVDQSCRYPAICLEKLHRASPQLQANRARRQSPALGQAVRDGID